MKVGLTFFVHLYWLMSFFNNFSKLHSNLLFNVNVLFRSLHGRIERSTNHTVVLYCTQTTVSDRNERFELKRAYVYGYKIEKNEHIKADTRLVFAVI